MAFQEQNLLTPRESVILEHETEEKRLAREHAVRIKELELALAREEYQARIELKKLEAKWSSLLKIPATIIKLPVYLLLTLGYLLDALRGNEPSKDFWKLLN